MTVDETLSPQSSVLSPHAVTRRALLGAAAGAVVALLAACGGPEGETTFRSARTATPIGAEPGSTVVASGGAQPTESARVTAVGTIFPTPKQGAPMPDLLRMLGYVPNATDPSGGLLSFLSRWKGTLSYANLAQVKKRYGYDTIHAFGDLATQNINPKDYADITAGCYLSEFTGLQSSQGGQNQSEYRDAFGYDVFQVDREISAGQPLDYFSRMEGSFDASGIVAKLQAGGYLAAEQSGIGYYTVRGDGELNLSDPRGRLALGRMNRVAVDKDRITAAPKTDLMIAALDAEAKKTPALDASATLRALATVLGDVTSMATIPPGTSDAVEAVLQPGQLAALTRDWKPLHAAELNAMGYTDAGNNKRTMHVALVYANPGDAAADAPELVKRIAGYRFVRTQQAMQPTYATAVTSRTATVGSKGVLVADITLTPGAGRSRLWIDMLVNRDTLFLVTQPVNAFSSPPPVTPAPGGSALPATPRPGGTP